MAVGFRFNSSLVFRNAFSVMAKHYQNIAFCNKCVDSNTVYSFFVQFNTFNLVLFCNIKFCNNQEPRSEISGLLLPVPENVTFLKKKKKKSIY